MSFKTMALSPAGADLKVIFGPGVPDALREQIVQTWGSLSPRLFDSVHDALEATQSVAHAIVLTDGSVNLFDEHPDLVNPFGILQILNIQNEKQALETLTSNLTVAMIQQLAGKRTMLHAAAIGDPATKRALVLVGASGRGKTTAAQYLGKKFTYLTDETTIVGADREIYPYPKPLSLVVSDDEPKEQHNPVELGLNAADCEDTSYTAARVVMVGRTDEPTKPYLERVSLGDALMSIAEQTSGVALNPEGVLSIIRLFEQCGGVWRLVYSEVEDIEPLVRELLAEDAVLPNSERVDEYETFEVLDRLPNVYPNGTQVLQRMFGTTGYLVDGERFLLHHGDSLDELSAFAAECWINAAHELTVREHYEVMRELFEGLPEDAHRQVVDQLSESGILTMRTVDDPLYTEEDSN